MPAASHPTISLESQPPCTQTHSIYNNSVLSGFQVYLQAAQSTSLRDSFGWSNQRGSKTSQACHSHPWRNLNIIRLFRFSLPLPVFGRLFLSIQPRGHKPTAPVMYCAIYQAPGSSAAVFQSPVMRNIRRSSATQSVYFSPSPPGHVSPRSPTLPA